MNSSLAANIDLEPHPRGINVQNIPHSPVYFARFAVYIKLCVTGVMRVTLSARKYKQLALESLRNSLRLLKDAISLYRINSYPTAFQLAVLAMEEYAKAGWVDHVYYSSITNNGLPNAELEQSWLKLLYLHPEKQQAFLSAEYFEFSPALHHAAKHGDLDRRKQNATYVGLPKRGRTIDVNARVSVPTKTTQADAKQLISLVASEIKGVYRLIERNDTYFGIEDLNEVITSHEAMFVFSWRHRSGLKSTRFRVAHGLAKLPKASSRSRREK
ncbi:AbiV family abortive infection protein [Acidovorax sp.]|uniref:AbiV family abortive infection protein n=1 Tax=Acidovorax sp. TaxID=1872122 RepID=UPI0026319116|nr:AbiV family abortive infection protein [Acidovorax sp.]